MIAIPNGWGASAQVEIRDINTETSTYTQLCMPTSGFDAIIQNNKIIFFTGFWNQFVDYKFDVYDLANNTWQAASPNEHIFLAGIISVNNIIYVAGGYVNGVLSNQVWKLEF